MTTKETFNIGLIGTGFMGKGHSMAYTLVPRIFPDSPIPHLRIVSDVSEDLAKKGAAEFGFDDWVVGWEAVVNHPEVDIVDISTPNHLHKEIAIAAAKAGKHIYCEKPLALTAEDAKEMVDAAESAGVKTMVGFSFLKNPAALAAKQLIDDGKLGDLWHFRAHFLQDALADPTAPFSWRFEQAVAGAGALGDLAPHIISMMHYLVGDVAKLCGMTKTFIKERPVVSGNVGYGSKADANAPMREVENDDAVHVLLEFANGATGILEASRIATGRKVHMVYEINGSKGSLRFEHERMNEFKVYFSDDAEGTQGFRTILTGPEHPYYDAFWPVAGCGLGMGDTKVIEIYELLDGIANNKPLYPDFKTGWQVNQFMDAVITSAAEERWVRVGQ